MGKRNDYQATQPAPAEIMPIDLITSWRLAVRQNPSIGLAQQVVQERVAYLLQARTIAVPSLNAGANYHLHNGNLQRSSGAILDVPTEQVALCWRRARTVAAETVAFPRCDSLLPIADAWYAPLAARQEVAASQFDVRATSNSILIGCNQALYRLARGGSTVRGFAALGARYVGGGARNFGIRTSRTRIAIRREPRSR